VTLTLWTKDERDTDVTRAIAFKVNSVTKVEP